MIRSKTKIYGDLNDPNTVIMPATTGNNRLLLGNDMRTLVPLQLGDKRLIIVQDGIVSGLNYGTQFNKVIGTDGEGNIVLLDRSIL